MKTLFTLVILLVSSIINFAQPHRFIKNYNDDVYNLIPCDNENFYSIAVHPGCGINSFNIRYLNRKGDVVRSGETPLGGGNYSVFKGVTDEDNDLTMVYYMNGDYNLVMQVDTNLNEKFCRVFSPSGYQFNKITSIGNSFYICGRSSVFADSVTSVIIKLNSTGGFEWSKKYTMPGWQHLGFNDMVSWNGKLLVGGFYGKDNSMPERAYPYMASVDTMGNLLEQYVYTIDSMFSLFEPYKITTIDYYDEDKIFVKCRASAGVDCLMQLDGDMNSIWNKDISGDLETICATYEGTVLFNTSSSSSNAFVQLGPSGTVVGYHAQTFYGPQASYIGRWDCGYLIGTKDNYPSDTYSHSSSDGRYCDYIDSAYSTNVYTQTVIRRPVAIQSNVISLNNYLDAPKILNLQTSTVTTVCEEPYACSLPVGIEPLGPLKELMLYPNPVPTGANFTVTGIENTGTGDVHISLYDISGRLVKTYSSLSMQLSTHGIIPGSYYLVIDVNGTIFKSKLIVN